MSGGPRQGGIQKQLQFMSDQLRGGASGSPMGLGAAMSGPKTGLGTAMMGSVGPRPAGGMSDAAKTYAAAAKSAMNSTNSGTPKSGTNAKPMPGGGPLQGLGAAMSGPKTGIGTAMGMNKMAGAGAALGKSFGMKSGGAVGSASKRADGIATKGKTKGTMVSMKNGGKAC